MPPVRVHIRMCSGAPHERALAEHIATGLKALDLQVTVSGSPLSGTRHAPGPQRGPASATILVHDAAPGFAHEDDPDHSKTVFANAGPAIGPEHPRHVEMHGWDGTTEDGRWISFIAALAALCLPTDVLFRLQLQLEMSHTFLGSPTEALLAFQATTPGLTSSDRLYFLQCALAQTGTKRD